MAGATAPAFWRLPGPPAGPDDLSNIFDGGVVRCVPVRPNLVGNQVAPNFVCEIMNRQGLGPRYRCGIGRHGRPRRKSDIPMSEPAAKVIKDSVSPTGHRLLTMEVTMHRYVLAEFNTHRVFSRNSASSRAIPTSKQLERVRETPANPIEFGANQPGMQAEDVLSDDDADTASAIWTAARKFAANAAEDLAKLGVHKQVVNRLLEPFMWHTVIVTSTEWDGFYKQRVSPLAQPEIKAAASLMLEAHLASTPVELDYEEWHTPYILDDEDFDTETAKKISAARCARVSYLTHDGVRDPDKDLELFARLVEADPPHASPLEHVATPGDFVEPNTLGNLRGWSQLRHDYWPDY